MLWLYANRSHRTNPIKKEMPTNLLLDRLLWAAKWRKVKKIAMIYWLFRFLLLHSNWHWIVYFPNCNFVITFRIWPDFFRGIDFFVSLWITNKRMKQKRIKPKSEWITWINRYKMSNKIQHHRCFFYSSSSSFSIFFFFLYHKKLQLSLRENKFSIWSTSYACTMKFMTSKFGHNKI